MNPMKNLTKLFLIFLITCGITVIPGCKKDAVNPAVTTAVIISITNSSAVSGGTITNDGRATITARGVCWSKSSGPTTADNVTNEGQGTGAFTSSLTGLSDGVTYYVRAYATNKAGTSYGDEINFITSAIDVEGNLYKTVLIGTQVWTAENLRSTKFNDNTLIPNVTNNTSWLNLTTAAYSWYNNDIANKDSLGALYNWFATSNGKLCPTGWHVPTDIEYNTLGLTLGIQADSINQWGYEGTDQGSQMKTSTGWDGNGNGTNKSGFSARPGGYRQWTGGDFWGLGSYTYFWTGTDDAINNKPTVAWYRQLDSFHTKIYKATTSKTGGKYIRCVKN
jgi:uncharacterized protein (TIGR02145 family)